jgi:hypothetical protein
VPRTDTSRATISIAELPAEALQRWLSDERSPIYATDEQAAAALAPVSPASTIQVVARLAGH